jgi:hypothetical protein
MIKFLLFRGILWLGEAMIVFLFLIPLALLVYASLNVAFLGLDIYKAFKRVS